MQFPQLLAWHTLPFETTPPAEEVDLGDPWVVTPGIEGFIVFAILGVALWLLVTSMIRHIRKANFRAAEREDDLYGPAPGSSPAPGAGSSPAPDAESSPAPDAGRAKGPEASSE